MMAMQWRIPTCSYEQMLKSSPNDSKLTLRLGSQTQEPMSWKSACDNTYMYAVATYKRHYRKRVRNNIAKCPYTVAPAVARCTYTNKVYLHSGNGLPSTVTTCVQNYNNQCALILHMRFITCPNIVAMYTYYMYLVTLLQPRAHIFLYRSALTLQQHELHYNKVHLYCINVHIVIHCDNLHLVVQQRAPT